MYVIYVAIAVFILHALSLPLIFSGGASVDTDADRARMTVKFMFVPIFVKNFDVKSIKRKLGGAYERDEVERKQESADSRSPSKAKTKRFLTAFALRMLRRIRLRALECNAEIGTGDAAASAMTAGSANIALLQVCAYFGIDSENIKIMPNYNDECLFLDVFGIISFGFADIIFAVCAALFEVLRARSAKRSYYATTVTE